MKRWLVVGFVATAAVLSLEAVRRHFQAIQKHRREAGYESTVRAYSEAFKPGITRKEAEARLRAKGNTYWQMCSAGEQVDAYGDLVKIGEEAAPWICTRESIYVVLQFAPAERPEIDPREGIATRHYLHERSALNDSADVLTKVFLYRRMEGCPDS